MEAKPIQPNSISLSRSALWRIARHTPLGAVALLESGLLAFAPMSFLVEYLGAAEWSMVQDVLPRFALSHENVSVREGALIALARFAEEHSSARHALKMMAERDPNEVLRKMAREELDECPE